MDLILLSGNSFSHKEWILDVEKTLHPLFGKALVQDYKHWQDNSPVIYLNDEVSILKHELAKLSEPYVVFAKSAGTLLALKSIYLKVINPVKCIFLGLPVGWGKTNGFEVGTWLRDYTVPTLFVQKTHDPAMSFVDMKEYLTRHNVQNAHFKEVPGDDHYYGDFELIKRLVKRFVF